MYTVGKQKGNWDKVTVSHKRYKSDTSPPNKNNANKTFLTNVYFNFSIISDCKHITPTTDNLIFIALVTTFYNKFKKLNKLKTSEPPNQNNQPSQPSNHKWTILQKQTSHWNIWWSVIVELEKHPYWWGTVRTVSRVITWALSGLTLRSSASSTTESR